MKTQATVAATNWNKLSPERKFKIALELARTRRTAWKRRFANVQNIGVGFRTRDKNIIDHNEMVLRFIVKAKKKRVTKGKIPGSLQVFWKTGRRRLALAVPTDIFAHDRGRLHDGFIGAVPDGRRFRGSACCVCKDADRPGDPPYLLSCHHVLTGSILDPNNPPRPLTGTIITRNNLQLGPCTLAGTLAPSFGSYAIDAAFLQLSLPTSMQASAGFWTQISPRRLAVMGEIPNNTQTLGIFSFRGMIPARFVGVFPNMDVEIRPGVTLRFKYIMESDADTMEGDSGSALMDASGAVFGVHFYGGKSPQFNGGYSLAIPIWTISGRQNYFGRNFVVMNPHP